MKKRIGRPPTGAVIPLTVHLTPAQHRKLLKLALKKDRPLTAVIREMVESA